MKRKMKKAIALLLAGIICVSMYGCSGNTKESAELQKEDAKTTGMGRYVEKTVLEPDGNDGPVQIQELSDGTLVYFDTLWKYVSKDNGETWNKEETNWLYELNEDNYFIDSAIAKDGNILMEYENFSDIERGLYCNCHRMTVTAGCPLPGLEQMRFSPGEGKAGLFFEI